MDMSMLSVTMNVSAPVLIMIFLGTALRYFNVITDEFLKSGSKFVFYVSMPALLFITMSNAKLDEHINGGFLFFFAFAILATCLVSFYISKIVGIEGKDRWIFSQVSFRGNCGIYSFALSASMFGEQGLVIGGVLASLSTFMFNIIAETTLGSKGNFFQSFKSVFKNPMVLSVCVGFMFSLFEIRVPGLVYQVADHVGSVSFPVALICVGGALATSKLKVEYREWIAISIKVFLSPFLFIMGAFLLGFSNKELAYLFIFLSAPTAASAYVAAIAHGNDGVSTANSIAVSTVIASVLMLLLSPLILSIS